MIWICWQCGKILESDKKPEMNIDEYGHRCRFSLYLGKGYKFVFDPISFEEYGESEAQEL